MLRKPTLADFGLTTIQFSDYLNAKAVEEETILNLSKGEFDKLKKEENNNNIGCLLKMLFVLCILVVYIIFLCINSKDDFYIIIGYSILFSPAILVFYGILKDTIKTFRKKGLDQGVELGVIEQIRKRRAIHFQNSYKLFYDFEEKLKSYEEKKLEERFPEISNFNFNLLKYSESIIKSILEKEEQTIKKELETIYRKNEVNYWLSLDGYTFEEEIAKLYISLGHKVKITPKSGDGGIDLILHNKEGKQIFVQCKNHKKPVGVGVIRELLGVVASGGAEKGILICSSGTTNGGIEFGKKNSIEILTVHDVVTLNKKVNPTPTNTRFDLEPKFSTKRKNGIPDNSFVLKGNVYVYNDIWDSASEAMKIIKSFQPVSSSVFEIVQYSKDIFYFKLYLKEHMHVYKRNDSIIVDAETGAIIQEPIKEEYHNNFTSYKPYKKKRYYYRKWR